MVFQLLESIYFDFDRLADHLKVFKVETIGDCCKCLAANEFRRCRVLAQFAVFIRRRCGVRTARTKRRARGGYGPICKELSR
jgi:Adenylate and Guanylate cyclase catalytic domain